MLSTDESEIQNPSIAKFGEADVRGEIIDPLLRKLGYAAGTENNIAREHSLRYAKAYLGRKKPKTDPDLQGRADYVCEVRGVARWVVEAKPANAPITIDDVEQACSYAAHPEVQAFIYAICNGHRLQLYETFKGALAKPSVEFSYNELEEKWAVLENLLSPEAIWRRHLKTPLDVGNPIARGMGSRVRVLGGNAQFVDMRCKFPAPEELMDQQFAILKAINSPIGFGECYRLATGQIEARVQLESVFTPMATMLRQFGLNHMIFRTASSAISSDPTNPTVFEGLFQGAFPAGTLMFNAATLTSVPLPISMNFASFVEALGWLREGKFSGDFFQRVEMSVPMVKQDFVVEIRGAFQVTVE